RTQDAGHALLRQGRNPKVRKNSGVIAFTLNSPAYQVPFAIIPSSPIELGECGTKISSYHFFCSLN
ncbi:hypothetical protein, partial [Bifidobacterium adolescentis]|uniref:hypothetical protein n=1 Tax=Bifidobacterium adolescentis TaxID=1680 RepID=UPI0034A41D59